jgi:hypothetical protein
MADESSKSWSSTVIIYVIIFILVIAAIIIIYYVLSLPQQPIFPVSPFDYDDIVEISPAVFTQDKFGIKDVPQNQFLTSVTPGNNCQHPNDGNAQPATCVTTFSGVQGNLSSKWILRNSWNSTKNCPPDICNTVGELSRCPTCPNILAKQSFYEFGNRFYLQNATAASPGDITALMTYMSFNGAHVYNPSVTFPLTGNTSIPIFVDQRYDSPFVVYFLPTSQPNLYYILFPGEDYLDTPNSININDGIISLRPFSQPNDTNYYPWNTNGNPNPNGPLLNYLPDRFVSSNVTALGTNRPNIFLFKITKVGKAS